MEIFLSQGEPKRGSGSLVLKTMEISTKFYFWILEVCNPVPTLFKPPLGLPCMLSPVLLSREQVALAISNRKELLVHIRSSLKDH